MMTIEVKNSISSNPKNQKVPISHIWFATEIKIKLPKFLVRLPRLSHLNKRLKANHEKPRIISLFFLFAFICYAWSIANRTDICTYKIIIYTVWGFVICYLNIKNEALNFMKWCPGKRVAFYFRDTHPKWTVNDGHGSESEMALYGSQTISGSVLWPVGVVVSAAGPFS